MNEIIRVTDVEPMEGLWIRATFSDGSVKEIGLDGLLSGGGVFAAIHDRREIFEQVRVNPEISAGDRAADKGPEDYRHGEWQDVPCRGQPRRGMETHP